MNNSQRYERLHKLVKIQEQMVLVEFRELQRERDSVRKQIYDLNSIGRESVEKLGQRLTSSFELAVIKSFAANLEGALEVLQRNLIQTENDYSIVGQKIKEVRSTLVSVSRLIDKSKITQANAMQLAEQKLIDEYLGYYQAKPD